MAHLVLAFAKARLRCINKAMSNYTIVSIEDIENAFASKGWPGSMRFLTKPLSSQQVALTHRIMPQYSGGKGGYGHSHKTQEEIVYVIRGELEVKLNDKVKVVKASQAIRIAPEVVRSLWNEQREETEILIISTKIDSLSNDVEIVKDFWPVGKPAKTQP